MAQHLRIGSVVVNPQAGSPNSDTAVVTNITGAYIELEDVASGIPRAIAYPWDRMITVVTD